MKVEGSKSSSSVQKAGGARKATSSSGDFAAALDSVAGADVAPAADSVDTVSGVLGVGGILAAQTVTDDQSAVPSDYRERQRRAQRGKDLLDRLEDVRRGLLIGAIPKDKLADLARTMREKRERGADPIISRLMDEIELRAEVELAKLARKPG